MAYEPPVELHLTSHRAEWWMLLPAAAIAVVALCAWLSSLLFPDEVTEAAGLETDWTVPLVSIGGIVVMVVLLWAVFVAWGRATERRKALGAFAHGLARWPQYATEAQWRQETAKEDKPEGNRLDVVIPVGIVTALIGAIAVAAAINDTWALAVVLAGFWVVLVGLVGGRRWNQERERRGNQARRRRLQPYPSCVVAAEALYHEDWGLVTLDQVTEVRVVPPGEVPQTRKRLLSQSRKGEVSVDLDPFDRRLARAGWSLLQFTLDSRTVRTWWQRIAEVLRAEMPSADVMPVSVVHVRVPPGCESEAAHVAAAVEHRWLRARDTLF
jgi:hypothetical protein